MKWVILLTIIPCLLGACRLRLNSERTYVELRDRPPVETQSSAKPQTLDAEAAEKESGDAPISSDLSKEPADPAIPESIQDILGDQDKIWALLNTFSPETIKAQGVTTIDKEQFIAALSANNFYIAESGDKKKTEGVDPLDSCIEELTKGLAFEERSDGTGFYQQIIGVNVTDCVEKSLSNESTSIRVATFLSMQLVMGKDKTGGFVNFSLPENFQHLKDKAFNNFSELSFKKVITMEMEFATTQGDGTKMNSKMQLVNYFGNSDGKVASVVVKEGQYHYPDLAEIKRQIVTAYYPAGPKSVLDFTQSFAKNVVEVVGQQYYETGQVLFLHNNWVGSMDFQPGNNPPRYKAQSFDDSIDMTDWHYLPEG